MFYIVKCRLQAISSNNMATEGKRFFWLSAGVLTGVGVSLCISELRRRIRHNSTRHTLAEIQDAIALEDLATLARSPNISLKRSAEQVILERAMKDKNLEFIVNACKTTSDEVQVLKGITVVGVLVKSSEFRTKLIAFKVIETLAQCLDYSIDPGYKELEATGGRHVKVQRVIISALFDLVCDDDRLKNRLSEATPTVISSILYLMSKARSKEIMRWSIFVIHQLSLCDTVRPKLVDDNVITIVAQVFVKNRGDSVLMRLCLQTLVMCANSNEEGEIQALHEMAKYNVIQPAVAALKSDDSDLVYWATALVHEYSVKDLYKAEICAIPNIIKTLQGVLATSEAVLQRIVLRVISFLCLGDQEFRNKVLNCNSILKRLVVCFASGDPDVVHWAVVLFHDLLLSSGSSGSSSKELAEKMINVCENIIKALVALTDRKDNGLIRVVAEIIGFFSSVDFPSESLQKHLIADGALNAVITFLQSSDSELQLWSSALLLNLCMTSDSVKEEIIRLGGIKPLIELAIMESDQHPVAAQSAKTLVMLGFVDQSVPVKLEISQHNSNRIARILFDGKLYNFEKSGFNICVLDFLTFKITDVLSYDTGHDSSAAARLIEGIGAIPYGSLVFVLCSGMVNNYMTFEASESLREIGIVKYDFKSNEPWAYVGQKREGLGEQIAIFCDNDHVVLKAEIALGRYVNELVLTSLLLPIIELMMSSPPSSAISKVSELELLTIMARHDDHKQVMVLQKGFLKYLADLCWNVSSNSAEYLRENPMFIAHCIGALKIISSISIAESFNEQLLASGVLGAVLALLYFVNEVSLSKVNHATAEKLSTLSSKQDTEEFYEQSQTTVTSFLFPRRHSAEDVSFDERKQPLTPGSHSDTSSTPEDFEDAFCTIVRLAVTTIYNSMGLFAGIEESRCSLFKSGTLQTLWCTLLTSNETTLAQIGLPIEALLNCFGSMGITEKGALENVIELDDRSKTAALILSADHLEVYNLNWTFESIRATTYVGRMDYQNCPHPDGWYYEVILRSNGILQIGWQTEGCRYGPEKGVGVGDDYNSCAFDGARCKVWNGPASEHSDNDYGTEWQDGDVLSCLCSWEGDMSFWINGVDQGIAFSKMNTYLNWYPAASLAMDQHCVFNFGRKPFRYALPHGYVPIRRINTKFQQRLFSPLTSCWSPMTENLDPIEDKSDSLHTKQVQSIEDLPEEVSSSEDLSKFAEDKHRVLTPASDQDIPDYDQQQTPTSMRNTELGSSLISKSTVENGNVVNHSASWLKFSPGESLSVECNAPSFPCFYFEAELKNGPSKVKQMGFFCTKTSRKIYCDLVAGQLHLPKTSHQTPSSQECYRSPEVVGCGILWPAGVVFFTLDGVGTGKHYQFPSGDINLNDLFPYISCSRISCNYGQKSFLFEGANFKEVSFAGANLLHGHGLSSEITSQSND